MIANSAKSVTISSIFSKFERMKKSFFYALMVILILTILVVTPFILYPRLNTDKPKPTFFCGTQSPREEAISNFSGKYHLEKELGYTIDIDNGSKIFDGHCAFCHSLRSKLIGPPLSGLRASIGHSPDKWLSTYLSNSKKLIQSGDKRAYKLHSQYKKFALWNHTDSSYSTKDKRDLIGFLLLIESD
jgi:hypothetical protein